MTNVSGLPPRARRAIVVAVVLLAAVLGFGQPAVAHTDFAGSEPTDGAVVDGPVEQITISFTNPATPAAEGFAVLDPSGSVLTPEVETEDGTVFVLRFDPPLGAGSHTVRWQVQAGDAHPLDGVFAFDVTVAEPAAAITPAATGTAGDPGAPASGQAAVATDTAVTGATSLETFLSAGSGDDAAAVGGVGRTFTFFGTIFGVGALAALVWVIRGHRDELRHLIAWIRLAGIVIAAGGIAELAAAQSSQGVDVTSLIGTKHGFAALLKVIGGVAIWSGFHARAGRVVVPPATLSAAALVPSRVNELDDDHLWPEHHDGHRWTPTASAAIGLLGYAAVLASYWFDGHTVSEGPWLLHSLVNFVHLGAAAVWGGGVFAMATVAWLRHRRGDGVGMAAMVVRFSSVATVSLATVIVAGLTMAVFILDSPAELLTTEWGRVLLAKTTAVSVAAGLGGFNHFRMKPALDDRPNDPEVARRLRTALAAESVVFVVITFLTAWLVVAAT